MSDDDRRTDDRPITRETPTGRRQLLAAGVGITAAAGMSGCVIKKPEAAQPAAQATSQPSGDAEQPAGSAPAAAGPAVAKAADVPNGGGKVLEKEKVVLTRDAGGQLRGFTAVCTHAGCIVASVAGGTINCPCHGSKFDVATGQPVAGPAKAPLKAVTVRQSGDSIYLK